LYHVPRVAEKLDGLKKRPKVTTSLRAIGVIKKEISDVFLKSPKLWKDTFRHQKL